MVHLKVAKLRSVGWACLAQKVLVVRFLQNSAVLDFDNSVSTFVDADNRPVLHLVNNVAVRLALLLQATLVFHENTAV